MSEEELEAKGASQREHLGHAKAYLEGGEPEGGHRAADLGGLDELLPDTTLRRWRADYRKVFPGEGPEGEVFEARLRAALEVMRELPGLSRLEALRLVKEREGGTERKGAPDRWTRAYIEVFGGEPQGEEGARRLEATRLLYDPERGIGWVRRSDRCLDRLDGLDRRVERPMVRRLDDWTG